MRKLSTIASLTLAAAVSAQSPLDTFPVTVPTDNGLGIGTCMYFDLNVTTPVSIQTIDINTFTGGSGLRIDVWTAPGGAVANANTPAAWTQVSTGNNGVGAGFDNPTNIDVTDFQLFPGLTGVFIAYVNCDQNYLTGGAGIPTSVSTAEMTLTFQGSAGGTTPGTGIVNTPRLFSGALNYTTLSGLFPSFTQDVSSGVSPLLVNFTDTTFTDDPGGVLNVRFDFESDGTYDATTTAGGTVSNTYACGNYDVTIEATDATNGVATATVTDAVVADPVNLTISASGNPVNVGDVVSFSANATPGATFAWDLDGDGSIDDVTANPTFSYATAGTYTVSCTASLACNTETETLTLNVLSGVLLTPAPAAGNFWTYFADGVSFIDVTVTNPNGIILEELLHRGNNPAESVTVELYQLNAPLTTTVGNEDPANFTLVASGTGTSVLPLEPFAIDIPDQVLPPGTYGFAIVNTTGTQVTDFSTGGQVFSTPDVSMLMNGTAFALAPGEFIYTGEGWCGGLAYKQIDDLFPGFSADVTSGVSPLSVNFTDETVTNDPIGVLSWAWDFENDGTVDSTAQNPTALYPLCGDYDVSLAVVDATNGTKTLVKPSFIQTDLFAASFDQSATLAGTSSAVNFTYTGDPAASVSWDLDTNGTIDAVGPTASFTYPAAGTYTITMVAQLSCRTETVTSTIDILAGNVIAANPGPGGGTLTFSTTPDASYMEMDVTNPAGVTITNMLFRSTAVGTVHDFNIYVQYLRSPVGNYSAGNWTLISTGSATPTVSEELFNVDVTDFGLPAGVTGIAVTTQTGSHTWFTGNSGLTSSDANLALTPLTSNSDFTIAGDVLNDPDSFAGGWQYSIGGGIAAGTTGVFGDGCAGTFGVPGIQPGAQQPQVNTTFAARITNVPSAVQIHGGVNRFVNPQFGGIPLPVNLGPILGTAADCRFFTSSEVILLAFPNAFNEAVLAFPIPNAPQFVGITAYIQGLVFDGGAPAGIITSDALFGVVAP